MRMGFSMFVDDEIKIMSYENALKSIQALFKQKKPSNFAEAIILINKAIEFIEIILTDEQINAREIINDALNDKL